MATTRVPNRYIARIDLIELLARLFPAQQYTVTVSPTTWKMARLTFAGA